MKRQLPRIGTMVVLGAILLHTPVFAQQFTFRSDHYHVHSEVSEDHARQVAHRLEAHLQLFNEYFRFPLNELADPLTVRMFRNRSRYDAHVERILGQPRRGAVYLHFDNRERNELVSYLDVREETNRAIAHQSLLQFMRAFVPHPPLWIREGFAAYFEAIQYDSTLNVAVFQENLLWLDTLQRLATDPDGALIPVDEALTLSLQDAGAKIETFYPQAWGMVSFLLHAERPATNRILWDSLSALSSEASREENEARIAQRILPWVNISALQEEFIQYIDAQRTFRGWIVDGIAHWEQGDTDGAEQAFNRAIRLRQDNHVPFYYLGLINYNRGNHGLADYYYQLALDAGSDPGITLFALGINAFADDRLDEASLYLRNTIEADPRFRDQAEALLARIGS